MNQTTMKRSASWALTALAGASLVACGGGSGVEGGISGDESGSLRLLASESMQVSGVASTDDNLLKSISWQVSPQDLNAPDLLLSNDTCTVVEKTDKQFAPSGTTRTGASRWVCDLGVIAPDQVSKEYKYNLLLSGVTDRNEIKTFKQVLTLVPNPNAPPVTDNYGAAGTDFSISMGQEAPLSCVGNTGRAPYSYQWIILDNAGLPLTLSSYEGSNSSFTAPAVTADTVVKIGCRVTDARNRVRQSTVKVTIKRSSVDTLVASTPSGIVAKPGQATKIEGSATWYGTLGTVTSGPVIEYTWSLGAGVPAGTKLLSTTGKETQLYVPQGVNDIRFIPVILTAKSVDKVSTSTVEVLVDPFADIGGANLSLEPAMQNAANGEIVTIDSKVDSTVPLYYQWTVVQGPEVVLAGSNAKKVQFVAPSVTQPTVIRLRLAVGYGPISASNPGVYFSDAIVNVGMGSQTPEAVTSVATNLSAQTVVAPTAPLALNNITATATGAKYFKWTQTAGTTVQILNDTSATPTIMIPAGITANEQIVLSVAASTNPISTTNPGVKGTALINVTTSAPVASETVTAVAVSPALSNMAPPAAPTAVSLNATTTGSGTTRYYAWSVSDPSFQIINGNTANPSIIVPSGITANKSVTVSVAVSGNPISASNPGVNGTALINVTLSDPAAETVTAVAVSPALTNIAPPTTPTAFNLNATTTGSGTSRYYAWSVSDPSFQIVNGNTASASIIVPSGITADKSVTVSVAVSGNPISASNPGVTGSAIVFVDAP